MWPFSKNNTFLSKKQEVNFKDFCCDFYEKNILNPVIDGINIGEKYSDTARKSILEVDQNFANIVPQKFAHEIILLRFELFALAWLHQFGDKSAVAQSAITKHYLQEKKSDEIWNDLEPYNQAIARSSTLGNTPDTTSGRAHLGFVNTMRVDLFKQFYKQGYDPECVARALNRLFSEAAWKKGVTAGLLMLAFCDRLGFRPDFKPNKEAQFRLTSIIRGLYDGVRQSFEKIKIKS
jgi:hypothetical protein